MIERKRMEEDGLFLDSSEHWELFETIIYSYSKKYQGYERCHSTINIPIDVIRHMKLQHRDKIFVAIKRRE